MNSRVLVVLLAFGLCACPSGGGGGNGIATFAKSYGGRAHDGAASAIATADGGYLFAGTHDERIPGDEAVEGDFWLAKLDDLGDVRWQMAYGERLATPSTLEVSFRLVREAQDGGLWLGGHEERAEELSGDYREDGGNIAITRLDPDGQPVWASPRIYDSGAFPTYAYARADGTTDEELLNMCPTADGGLLTIAWLTATVVLPGTNAVVDAHAAHVMKITGDGDVVWSRTLYRAENDHQYPKFFETFRDIVPRLLIRETSDGGAIVGISGVETLDFVGNPDAEGARLELQGVRLLSGGERLWVRNYPHRWANDLIQIDGDLDGESDDGFLFAGSKDEGFEAKKMLFKIQSDGEEDWSFEGAGLGIYDFVVERCFEVPGGFRCSYAAVSLDSISTFLSDGTIVSTASKPNGRAIIRHREGDDTFVIYGWDRNKKRNYVDVYSLALASDGESPHIEIDGCTELVERASFSSSGNLLVPCGDEYLDGVVIKDPLGGLIARHSVDARVRMVERAHVVLETASNGSGSMDGYTVMGTASSFLDNGEDSVWFVRAGLDGRIQWQRVFEGLTLGNNLESVDTFKATANGEYVFGCLVKGSVRVAGMEADGVFRWFSSSIAPARVSALSSLDTTSDGGCVVAGDGFGAAWLARLDGIGAPRWLMRYTPSDFGVGVRAGSVISVPDGFVLSGRSAALPWSMKVDLDGQVVWSYAYDLGSLISAGTSRIARTPDGGYLLGTTVASEDLLPNDGIDEYAETGRRNLYLIKLDAEGTALWYRIYGGLYDEVLHDVTVLDDGGFLVSGRSGSVGDFNEAWILRLGPDGLLSEGCNAYLGGGTLQPFNTSVPVFAAAYTPEQDLIQGAVLGYDTAVLERVPADVVVARQCAGVATEIIDDPQSPVETFTLTVISAGPGSGTVLSEPEGIVCGPFCEAEFEAGSQVYLLAEPDFNYAVRWLGCDEVVGADGCLVTMDSDRTVYVNFDEPFAALTVEFRGAGSGRVVSAPVGIDCKDDCEAFFLQHTQVFLQPLPDPGYVFSHWEGCDPDGDFGVEGCMVTIDGARTVRAYFEPG